VGHSFKQSEVAGTPWFTNGLRVRYQESDQMAVVYHANYLNWFEMGRTELIRRLNVTYRQMEESGVLLPVTELDIQYKRPAVYDDEILVFTRIVRFNSLRLDFQYEVRKWTGDEQGKSEALAKIWTPEEERAGELLVTGSTAHVWVNRELRPVRLDKTQPELYSKLNDFFSTSL
jgi:acyl-CoA thioester hydrolase